MVHPAERSPGLDVMRGSDERTGSLFSYVDTGEHFAALYPPRLGRPSIKPERLLRGKLLQVFCGIRS